MKLNDIGTQQTVYYLFLYFWQTFRYFCILAYALIDPGVHWTRQKNLQPLPLLVQCTAICCNMKLNSEKCKEMITDFLQYNATKWQPICINGKQVEVLTVFKLLGVYLSSDLTWTGHCEYIIKKANRRLYALKNWCLGFPALTFWS